MNEIKECNIDTFDSIKHTDEYGNEFWYARELQKILEYSKWDKFLNVIEKSKESCKNSGYNKEEQFLQVEKLSERANNAYVRIIDYKLSRYACYLIVQNGDPRKEVIALG